LLAIITALAAAALPLSATAETKCSLNKILEFPVTMDGLRPIVPATINGHEVKFVADSGAFYSFISPGSAAELGLKLTAAPPGFYVRGVGGDAHMSIATAKDFGLGPSTLHNVEFLVGGSEVGGNTGLLGQNVLGLDDVEYDLANAAIRLFKPHDCPHTNLAYWAAAAGKPVSQLDIETLANARSHTAGIVILNGVKIHAMFDTGAPVSILTASAAARAGVKPDSPGVISAGFSSGLGRHSLQTWIGAFQGLKIGDEEIQKIHLRFGDLGDVDFDMLIGADFFVSHRVYVSNAQHRIYFTYNGGQVFDLSVKKPQPRPSDPAATGHTIADATAALQPGATKPSEAKPPEAILADGPEPTTADGYARRGDALAARLDFVPALADLTRACELAPDNAEYRFRRALILLRTGRHPMAMADLERALTLKPDYADALMLRAYLRLRGGDKAAARADLDAADHGLAAPADLRLRLGQAYETIGDLDTAITQYDRWIAAHPDDSRMPGALNGRCWARALSGHDLDKAIADCDRALRLRPHTPAYLDSRGLAHLRNGDLDKALADYQAALAIEPKLAASLYGRGIVEQKKGLAAEAKADIAAATAIDPDLPERMKKMGLAETTN
jgi:tetratricopeptide (TPR) repeat protein/predicted aspartyl protease